MAHMEKYEAFVTDVSFRNEENGFTVLQVRLDDGKRLAAVGIMPELASGERVLLTGTMTEHRDYGRQIAVSLCEIVRPTTAKGIERYLGSGLIRGVGRSLAKAIVEAFGESALDVMQYDPERLCEISGIGVKRARSISESFMEQQQMREAMVFMQTYGISPSLSMRIFKQYGERVQAVIRDNPYRLVEDIEGIGFRTADRIASAIGIAPDAPGRLRAGICFLLGEAAGANGHTYLPQEQLMAQAVQLLGAPEEVIAAAMQGLILDKSLIVRDMSLFGHVAVYLPRAWRAEMETARRLMDLRDALPQGRGDGLAEAVEAWQARTGIGLNEAQVRAVRAAVTQGVSVITGGPGTGKTTIIRCILSLLDADEEVLLAAPTGRAAKRMSEATGQEARTLHRVLEYGGDEGSFSKNADNPIETDVMIIDEMSMVDIFLMRGLLRALLPGTRLILVGDADQLPSVGAGNVLGDILQSGCLPVVRLKDIYRQSSQSMIVENAHRINHGEMPMLNSKGSDFFLERQDGGVQAAETIVKLAADRLPPYVKVDALRDIQVLSPMKKGECGVWALNRMLQARFNPPRPDVLERKWGETVFRVGDKVMQTRNDYQMAWRKEAPAGIEEGEGVFNGDMGIIINMDEDDQTLTVRFDDEREAVYENPQLEDLELAYCISVHKSQGSEFPVIVMPVVGGPAMLLTRNLFYTAVTRARQLVVLVGKEICVRQMVSNMNIAQRYSGLCEWLKMAMVDA